jgi:transcriptional regulator with XRE-family HTH domain
MLALSSIGAEIAAKRKLLGLTQAVLARRASVGRSTLDALENARMDELGYAKVARILSVLGLDLRLEEAGSARDEVGREDPDDQGLNRR